jgi:hypothetical protein
MEASDTGRRGTGWAGFAGVMIFVVGTFNVIWGIAALVSDDYFVADELLFGDLTLWGWIYLILGAIQVIVALLIFAGNEAGAVVGILLAILSAIGALLSIGAYPIWSIIILVVDALIIYALTVYGDALKPA